MEIQQGRKKTMKFMDLYSQNKLILEEFELELKNIIYESDFIGGKRILKFEREFSNFLNIENCVGVGNGTDAIEIALLSLEIPMGAEIIVPSNSFIASAEAVKNVGYEVRWVECDDTCNIDPEKLKKCINSNTGAIIFVHLYGNPTNINLVSELAIEMNIPLIEDCAQAHGACLNGRMAGTFGDIGAFSFYPGKNLGAFGDAGAIVTSCEQLAERARMISNHGRKEKYFHEIVGRNSRLDVIQAAILSLKLKHLNIWNNCRQKNAEFYVNNLDNPLITLPRTSVEASHIFHHFVIKVKHVEAMMKHLKHHNIPYGQHYPYLLTEMPSFGGFGTTKQEIVSVPVHESLTVSDRDTVLTVLNKFKI